MRPVIVTTVHKGVFFGEVEENADTTGSQIVLHNCRMAIYWGTTRGLWQLAETGPTSTSKISALSQRVELRDITAVLDVSPAAAEAWRSVK
jgi:hypothetical protein